jgi:UDP-N-acetyl-D-galactosamine dehydrogenase
MSNSIYQKLIDKQTKLAVIGLGYVGLPIALEFARKIKVVGFDINQQRVDLMRNKIDPSKELERSAFEGCDIHFTADIEDLKDVTFFIVAVPTPIDNANVPDLRPLLGASSTVGKVLKKGDFVVFESTVYPGCTEEDCVPILEKESGLKFKSDFFLGYSPERINPGDKNHTLRNIVKVVSGCCEESLDNIAKTYELVVDAGVHRAATIKVAEAAKIIENTQRDVNIALINELSIIFNKLNINTFDVLEAAGTKWNFLKFQPGLVGGHCIGVDPYYLTHKAAQAGYNSKVITSGREVNDSMGAYVAKQTVKKMIAQGKHIQDTIINELKSYHVSVDTFDPHASSEEMLHEYGIGLISKPEGKYDTVIVAVNHKDFIDLTEQDFKNLLINGKGVFVDIKGIYRNKINELEYWSL